MNRNSNLKNIVYNSVFTSHQKFLIGSIYFVFFIVFLFNLLIEGFSFTTIIYFSITFLIFCLYNLKNGFLFTDNYLYKSLVLFKKHIYKEQVIVLDSDNYCEMRFKANQKTAFFSGANPDLAYDFSLFEFYLLNKTHGKKELICSVRDKEKSEKINVFLQDQCSKVKVRYAPPTARRRRR